jgi:serine/threonine protein kinase
MPVQNKSQVPIGTVLEGKFRITREIGRGGMAAVYEAENIDIGKRVAVKVLAAELITSRVVRERFIREARAAAAVRSPNICDVYDSGMYEERPFLVMELLEGESLYDLLTRLRRLDIPTTLTVATQTARGLAKAHDANIVHRDLKPENIFVSQDEDGGLIVKLLDFGLAKFYEPVNEGGKAATRLTREGALFGTPAYMSPEQAKGQGEVDHRADLWALGCIIYECLTGQTVWNVEQGVAMILAQVAGAPLPRPTKLRPDLPPTFDTWFMKALNRDADKRFQTARELADTLEDALVPSPAAIARAARSPSRPGSEIDLIETHAIDALIDGSTDVPTAREPVLSDVQPGGDALTPEPSAPKSRGPGALGQLMIAAVIALGGYAAWLYFLHPPPSRAKVVDKQGKQVEPATSSPTRPKTGKKAPPVDGDALVEIMSEAQELFAKEPEKALEKLKGALGSTQVPAVRSLYSHASVAVEEATKGGCKAVAIARPRPYDLEQPVSRAVILGTSSGAVLAWVDNHADTRKRQGHAVVLDEALRRTSVPIAITPEATNVQDLELLKLKDKLALLYWDSGGREPGVFVRTLEADGRIASPAKRISSTKSSDFDPTFVSASDGGYWVVWSEQLEYNSTDLVVRRLGPNLEPRGEAVRLTAFTLQKGMTRRATAPDIALSRSELQIAFSLQLPGQVQQVSVLTVPLADLDKGLEMPRPGKRVPPPKKDTVLGTLRSIKRTSGRNPEPHLECNAEACFVTWDEEKGGAFVAYLEHGKGAPLWHREFASKGARPIITTRGQHVELAWFEDSRVRMAQVTRDQVGTPSVMNRVNGLQPHPDLSPAEAPNGWYLTWRDYEAGHLEVFALRAECP